MPKVCPNWKLAVASVSAVSFGCHATRPGQPARRLKAERLAQGGGVRLSLVAEKTGKLVGNKQRERIPKLSEIPRISSHKVG